MDSEHLNTVWILISELFTKQYIYSVNEQMWGKKTQKIVQNKKKESTYFFSVCERADLRSSSKVAGFLCYLQCTLQILIKELTPDWHFQRIERVLEGEI